MADETPLLEHREGRVLRLVLNRPDRLNALTAELHDQLLHALEAAAGDDTIGAVVLTGAGRGFCAGGDVGGGRKPPVDAAPKPRGGGMEKHADRLRHHGRSVQLLHTMPKPTIAAVNGIAAGAGMALALACDFRVASADAAFRTSYRNIALSGDLGISYFLHHLVGPTKARDLMLFDRKIDAVEAQRIGLVSLLAEAGGFAAEVADLAAELAAGPPVAQRHIKRNLVLAACASLDQVIDAEAYAMARCARTGEAREAITAFREKRAPDYFRNDDAG
ncbi:MAG: enoyl-CoA hydratase-related protein [Candidatus Sphingomonas phytovorans]|nr:enoyl-CoA hydratase-related protein [Sphingomonas sp.]WEK02198.1 MAG: enoyl-CoA hydratase-related protein [Sphingomonas sp.]